MFNLRRQLAISVKRIKKIEIPSIPITIFKFKVGIQKSLLTNWKVPKDLLKKNHKNKEKIKVTHEICNAKDLIKCWLEKEITDKYNKQ
mgnify:CR=1 FL=1